MTEDSEYCPCGSGKALAYCCGPYLNDEALPPTAEALMRSRYTAFVQGNLDHLDRTHAPEIREEYDRLSARQMMEESKWQGLEIIRTIDGGLEDQKGSVEFIVRFARQGKSYFQHELASFRREEGVWVYESSIFNPKSPPRHVVKIGRNDPCTCGSGKKYKKCCGDK
jgi:SEC-C motif-containing protein